VASRGDGQVRRVRLWRWRRNPLRRREDVLEAWLVAAVAVLTVLGGVSAGLFAAEADARSLDAKRAERTPVTAVVLENAPVPGSGATRVLADVRWTGADGTARTARTLVAPGTRAGTELTLWTDRDDRPTSAPPTPTEAAVESTLLGVLAGLATAGTVCGTGAVLRWRLDRRRLARWDREWLLIGPRWGHRTG
jgi:hypothetical protein